MELHLCCISTAFVHDGDNINDALKIKEKTIADGDVNWMLQFDLHQIIFNILYEEIAVWFAEAGKSFCPTRVMERGREGGGRWEPEREVGPSLNSLNTLIKGLQM